jgi:hypothetical protein
MKAGGDGTCNIVDGDVIDSKHDAGARHYQDL